jgi:hypothetical protein
MDLSQRSEAFTSDDQSWLGSRDGTDVPQTCTIKTSTVTEATYFPDGYIPSGMPIAKFTSGGNAGKYTVLNTSASDGSETLVGYTLTAIPVPDATKDVVGAYIYRGRIKVNRLQTAYQSLVTSGVQSGNTRFIYTTTA